jgi:hypothetical protein
MKTTKFLTTVCSADLIFSVLVNCEFDLTEEICAIRDRIAEGEIDCYKLAGTFSKVSKGKVFDTFVKLMMSFSGTDHFFVSSNQAHEESAIESIRRRIDWSEFNVGTERFEIHVFADHLEFKCVIDSEQCS